MEAAYSCVCFFFFFKEQYQRDQKRLEAEWQRAQQDAMGELCKDTGVISLFL